MKIQTVFKQHHLFGRDRMKISAEIHYWVKEKGKWILLYIDEKVEQP